MVVSKTKALETKIGELRFRDLGASCFVFETTIKKKSINKLPLVSLSKRGLVHNYSKLVQFAYE